VLALHFQLRVTKLSELVHPRRIVAAVRGELADLHPVDEIIEILRVLGGGALLDPAQHLAVRVARERDGAKRQGQRTLNRPLTREVSHR
jgi:hypothetical protein